MTIRPTREQVFIGDPSLEVKVSTWERVRNKILDTVSFGKWTEYWTNKLQCTLNQGITKNAATYIRWGANVNHLKLGEIESKLVPFEFVASQANSAANRQLRNSILWSWKLCDQVDKVRKNLEIFDFAQYCSAAGINEKGESPLEDFKDLRDSAAEKAVNIAKSRLNNLNQVLAGKITMPTDKAVEEASEATRNHAQAVNRRKYRGQEGEFIIAPELTEADKKVFTEPDVKNLKMIANKIDRYHALQQDDMKQYGRIRQQYVNEAKEALKEWEKAYAAARKNARGRSKPPLP